ncbi:MAG: FAD-binding protein, partial [Streptococcaceae bacterium]|nr:FAD-binding protein [Streptococcaceae bacterium]
MDKQLILNELETIKILFDEPLKNYTFTKVGGPADVLVFPKTKEEVIQVIHFVQKENIPWLVLGNASNLIVRDGGIRGFVLMLTDMTEYKVENKKLIAQAGCELIDICKIAAEFSLSGLEFASGIP